MRRMATARARMTTALVVALVLTGACSGQDEPVGTVKVASTLGPGEGNLNLVTLPGAMESGGNDPRVDWVTPFQERTGCKVAWKVARNPREMTDLMSDKDRRYDGVAASPEVAGQLVATHQATPVNTNLVDGYKKLEPRLRALLKHSGKYYGVPYIWGSNLLMYDTRAVQAPSSWAALFEPEQARRYSGRVIVRDSPLAIAEAALYLKGKDRKLKIGDPYSLTAKQLAAVGRVLAKQRPHVKDYWALPADAVSAFAGGEAVLGEAWPYQVDVLTRASKPVQGVAPSEGVTGWMDAWMIGARVQHPNCMYQWLQWTASPDVQQQVAEWTGVAPANPQACSGDRLKSGFCNAYHVGDRAYLDKVIFAHTPTKECRGPGDNKGKHECTDYAEWMKTWIESTKQ
ncbi:extracellular solute-binding protein [Actinomadura rubrisoli]|uniref:Extracellular solute-binding protein n=1 Tax=Actinomadura rubrisoli TaxID=2530368 RepID=A0A4R5C3H7_9ACTN|nr:extracellular solute-binding protein [Actinomadura rubrisoli]TDD92613.1 extracellular solute-binding protein [Actinomadura rubrisoli]